MHLSARNIRTFLLALVLAASAWLFLTSPLQAQSSVAVEPRPLPDFPASNPGDWINSKPLSLAGLRGKVVLIDIWTTV